MEPGPAGISNFSPMDGASDLQWTVLQTISSRSRCDRRFEEAGSDLRGHRRAGIGTYFLKMTHACIAALPAEQIEHAPCLAREKTERAVQPSLM
jgi:hypothetical protein